VILVRQDLDRRRSRSAVAGGDFVRHDGDYSVIFLGVGHFLQNATRTDDGRATRGR
jgi:hypothetical protein